MTLLRDTCNGCRQISTYARYPRSGLQANSQLASVSTPGLCAASQTKDTGQDATSLERPSVNVAQLIRQAPEEHAQTTSSSLLLVADEATTPHAPNDLGRKQTGRGDSDHTCVGKMLQILFLSSHNGSPTMGLTELELFLQDGRRLELRPEDVSLLSGTETDRSGDISALVNGRARTTNERDMWLCRPVQGVGLEHDAISGNCGVSIALRESLDVSELGWLRVWNYNRGLSGIGHGVKDAQVVLDGEAIWKGVIAKGCGNPTFDYSTTIPIFGQAPCLEMGTPPVVCWEALPRGNAPHRENTQRYIENCQPSRRRMPSAQEPMATSSGSNLRHAECVDILPEVASAHGECGAFNQESAEGASHCSSGRNEEEASTLSRSRCDSPLQLPKRSLKAAAEEAASSGTEGLREGDNGISQAVPCASVRSVDVRADGSDASPRVFTSHEPPGEWSAKDELQTGLPGDQDGDREDCCTNRAPIWLLDWSLATKRSDTWDAMPEHSRTKMRPVSGRRSKATKGCEEKTSDPSNEAAESNWACEMPFNVEGRLESKRSSGRRSRRENILEKSLDSLSIFRKHQAGRIGKCDSESGIQSYAREGQTSVDNSLNFKDTFADAKEMMRGAVGRLNLGAFTNDDAPQRPDSGQDDVARIGADADVQHFAEGEKSGHDGEEIQCPAGVLEVLSSADESPLIESESSLACMDAHIGDAFPVSCDFAIPTRPSGQVVELRIFTTWGDPHYVGLSGVEIFDSLGQFVAIKHGVGQVEMSPEGAGVHERYGSDPRTPEKIVDGVSMTCDDLHVWLAPFPDAGAVSIRIDLGGVVELGMLRIWNYNKSRVHTSRGAREVRLALDGGVIFCGEIGRAPGNLAESPACAECILFTEEEAPLAAMDKFDDR
ncbi:unnamed protein product [Ostreobium quekettii]|uniref:KATNIP domain-containing protein n=1 Tax=Ostreobium quekettii TaxID=121088 RepID=A0A8S1J412_9CHLO|nr:unnamed protein product [Ostreobium quekettii]